jgi:RNA polymerase sigma factor (sigma-70 family)
LREQLEAIYRDESRRVLATLIRLLGDFDLAEEALHDAFRAALEQWPRDGVPSNPRAWLVSTGRFKAINARRRRARFGALDDIPEPVAPESHAPAMEEESVEDDQLRLVFTCCHPALPPEAQVALTLREVCGLTTEEIARAFLIAPSTLAQRIVRAKAKIRDARIPYEVPNRAERPGRLDDVLQVVYLVFNEGYAASSGGSLTRADLSGEAIRLGRLLGDLLPEPEAIGLLALMLLHESRRVARTAPNGDVILLEDQDRSLWNQKKIQEGRALVARAFASRRVGSYTPAGRDRRGPRRRAPGHSDGLEPDCRTLRSPTARRSVAGDRAEPRRRGGDAERAGSGSGPDRRDLGARRPLGISVGPLRARRSLPPAGADGRRACLVRTGPEPGSPRAGKAVPGATPKRAEKIIGADVDFRSPRMTTGWRRTLTLKERDAMKYICLGYMDPKKWDGMSENDINTFVDGCFDYDDVLRENGHFAGGEALQPPQTATTLRFENGKVTVTDGPYAETKEQLGGILILEARDLNHAIQLMSKHPGVRGGPFEIRPAADLSEMVAQSAKRRSKK